ncbi:MAG: YitT family protein [Bacilli bacterium]|nr:YitT family protein [Bacilli bacterium]
MKLFKKIDTTEIINKIYSKNKIKRYSQLIIGTFLTAAAFNLFLLPRKIVTGGVSGLSIVIESLFKIEPSVFILIANVILIAMSFICLGKEETIKIAIGALLFPLFVKLTANITTYIDLESADTLLISLFGGVLSGFGAGLVLKTGYSTGGTEILGKILSKYRKISMGNSILYINSIIILASVLTNVTTWITILYAIIILYISSIIIDKVLLGISNNKAFHIITTREKEIETFILSNLNSGITIIDAKGGYTGQNTKVLLCVIPTKDYFRLKEGIHEIDQDAFFVVTDAYEVKN